MADSKYVNYLKINADMINFSTKLFGQMKQTSSTRIYRYYGTIEFTMLLIIKIPFWKEFNRDILSGYDTQPGSHYTRL